MYVDKIKIILLNLVMSRLLCDYFFYVRSHFNWIVRESRSGYLASTHDIVTHLSVLEF